MTDSGNERGSERPTWPNTYVPGIVERLLDHEPGMWDEAAHEIMRLRERLEIGYAFDGDGKRIECEHDIDGITCRDETIKLQDDRIAELSKSISEAVTTLRAANIGGMDRLSDAAVPARVVEELNWWRARASFLSGELATAKPVVVTSEAAVDEVTAYAENCTKTLEMLRAWNLGRVGSGPTIAAIDAALAKNPEQRHGGAVAESQAPATSEPGDAGVAPGQPSVVPDSVPNPFNAERIVALVAAARELLTLYDWRPELAKLEQAVKFRYESADPKEVKRLLREYGERKKAGWIALRTALNESVNAIGNAARCTICDQFIDECEHRAEAPPQPQYQPKEVIMNVTAEMVTRFLSWPLPEDFAPDAGISFTPSTTHTSWPTGTNLLSAPQAQAMLQHILGVE